ncbi:hypothetical protein MZM54_03835 [[Brevibacterium] frigoritolerans]|nr:hypothetical protein [Peribacillus frigoritolerans]
MNILKRLFQKNRVDENQEKPKVDSVNENYVCLTVDPINTVNNLQVGDWNMDSVRESLRMGMLRYAKQSEVDKARELGLIKE